MLSSLIRSTLVAATLLGSFDAAAAAPREAAGVTLIDHRGERHHGRDRWDDRGPRHGDRWDHRGPRRDDRWDRGPRHGGGCSARLAVNKARDFGVRRAHVVRFDRRAVVVSGIKRGYPIAVRFAQARGCPVVGSR